MNLTGLLNPFSRKPKPKSHIRNLVDMAIADGEFCEAEKKLLRDIAKQNNISESQLQEIQESIGSVEFEMPKDDRERFRQLYDLIHMMIADKKIHKEELKLCDVIVSKFGYPAQRAKDIIETVRLNIENGNGYDETMKRLTTMLMI